MDRATADGAGEFYVRTYRVTTETDELIPGTDEPFKEGPYPTRAAARDRAHEMRAVSTSHHERYEVVTRAEAERLSKAPGVTD